VGALTAALAVAAHGAGGGEIPGSDSLTFLVVASLGVGVLAGSVGTGRSGRLALLPWLAGGQVVAHQALALAADHSHPVGPSMLTAHAVAVGAPHTHPVLHSPTASGDDLRHRAAGDAHTRPRPDCRIETRPAVGVHTLTSIQPVLGAGSPLFSRTQPHE
jgi:hypothetical protein